MTSEMENGIPDAFAARLPPPRPADMIAQKLRARGLAAHNL
jgi:hypothetical protein